MALRNITKKGEEILAKKCKPVKSINDRIKTLCGDMIETMIDADGVGLAAPQVGVMKRLFVARPDLDDEEAVLVFINPEITLREGQQECIEGCLSVPGYVGVVDRPQKVHIKALDIDGNPFECDFEGFSANVICHEYDHLDGVLYTDIAKNVLTNEQYEQFLKDREASKAKEEAAKQGEDEAQKEEETEGGE